MKRKAVDEARAWIRSLLTPVARMVRQLGGFEVAVGSSGTILNVAEMVHAACGGAPLRKIAGASFTADELDAVVDDLVSRPRAADRLEVPGLDPKRADIILGGVLVLEQAFHVLGIDEMMVSDYALREGVLLDVLRRRQSTSLGHLRDLRYESVLHLAALTPGEGEKEHGERVAELALQLFEGTRHRHGLDERYEELLEAAGLLCNVGLAISHDRHHLHSYYVIRNTDLLAGFTDHEVELIALVARYHRKSAPEGSPRGVRPSRRRRPAGGADRSPGCSASRSGSTARGRASSREVVVDDRGDDGIAVVVHTDGDAELELYSARLRSDLLADALDAAVEVVAA